MTGRRSIGAAGALACLVLALAVSAQDAPKRRGFSVKITEPADNAFVLGKTKIAAAVKAEVPGDVDRVEFVVNGKTVFVDREAPYEFQHDFGEDSKSWVVKAVAWHRDGVSVSDTIVTRKLTVSYVEEVNRVILWATVTTKKDQFVTGLKKEDFRVFEQGVEQEIAEFWPEDRPISIALLLDSSGSMREMIKELHAAASAFVDTLTDKDRALVIDFDDKVFLLEELTSDRAALREAVSSTEALGGTAIYDALHAAYRKLRGIEGRKAIILLSDGDDTESQTPYARVLEEAKSEGILVYTIGLGSGVRRSVLKDLADVTGGDAFFVGKADELAATYRHISDELRKQYYLTFSSRNTVFDGRYIEVRVATRNKDWDVRSRRGYFAVRAGETVKQARDAAKEKKDAAKPN